VDPDLGDLINVDPDPGEPNQYRYGSRRVKTMPGFRRVKTMPGFR
jgi:hypothetical protein